MGRLIERIALGPLPQPANRFRAIAPRLGAGGEFCQRGVDLLAHSISLAQHPVEVEIGKYLSAAERRDGLGRLPQLEQRGKLAQVDDHGGFPGQPHRLAIGQQCGRGGDTERVTDRRERGPQVRASALVREVGPQRGRDAAARMATRMGGQPSQQGTCGTPGGRLQRLTAQRQPQPTDDPHPQHVHKRA